MDPKRTTNAVRDSAAAEQSVCSEPRASVESVESVAYLNCILNGTPLVL
jgi:hypothetical protein